MISKKFRRRLYKFTLGLFSAAVTFCVAAEDTEIYSSMEVNAGKPNVLFIIDSSNSMNSQMRVKQRYDPARDYKSSARNRPACDNERIYWKGAGHEVPDCASDRWFKKDRLRCLSAAVPLGTSENTGTGVYGTGVYIDRIIRYNSDDRYWHPLNPQVHDPAHVECRADQPDNKIDAEHHGERTGDGNPYIRNGDPNPGPAYHGSAEFLQYSEQGWPQTYTLYTGNYLNWYHYHTDTDLPSRLDVAKRVLKDVIDSTAGIRAGVMDFNSNIRDTVNPSYTYDGGSVKFAISDIDDTVGGMPVRTVIKNIIDGVTTHAPSTPLTETLSEAYRYWTGMPVHYGGGPHYSRNPPSVPESRSGDNYKSPFRADCTANIQVVLTDGLPTEDGAADDFLTNLMATHNVNDPDNEARVLGSDCRFSSPTVRADHCFDNLAEYMNKVDLTPDDDPDVDQTVRTFVIGFAIRSPSLQQSTIEAAEALLGNAARHGGGQVFYAENALELATAFQEIISQTIESSGSFSSPAVSVNALNRLVHNDELYFGLFEPGQRSRWAGNVKRYRLGPNPSNADNLAVVDARGRPAIDSDSGQIKGTAVSWWRIGTDPDGARVTEGGLGGRLFNYNINRGVYDADSRKGKIFTYVEDYDFDDFNGRGIDLIELKEENADADMTGESPGVITKTSLGLPETFDDGEFLDLVKWARGVDTEDTDGDGDVTEGRPQMGAPLHVKPVVISYSTDADKNVVFSMTNDGYFHAARTEEPSPTAKMEHFAFMPKPLLKNIRRLAENAASSSPIYGLDGSITIWRNDADNDGTIEPSDGDHVYAYFGQRRGGRGIFALDVTDIADPELLWVINPDNPEQADDARFAHLGQSWAKPHLTKILIAEGGSLVIKDVIILAGGYDEMRQDRANAARDPQGDSRGHAIYIVDAVTGKLYWWTGRTDPDDPQTLKTETDDSDQMKYGFSGEIKTVDTGGDGITDIMIAADNGGQIWRFDIAAPTITVESLKERITGGIIADLQKSTDGSPLTAANNRKFYYPVDIAIAALDPSDPYLTIGIGSGFRAHPLDTTIQDRYYLIKDRNLSGPPLNADHEAEYTKLHEEDLLDVTHINLADSDTSLTSAQQRKLDRGWYLTLAAGEKVLSPSITLAGNVMFTTYTPGQPEQCTGNQGHGAVYTVRFDDARPVLDIALPNREITLEDRKLELKSSGIPPEPLPVYTEDGPVIIVGREILSEKPGFKTPEIKTKASYWFQRGIYR